MDIEHIEWLRSFREERSWLAYTLDKDNPQRIGQLTAALANAACLEDKEAAFLIWGIDGETRSVVGTTFDPSSTTVASLKLDQWLRNKLSPAVPLQFNSIAHPEGTVQLLEIPAAITLPVAFEGVHYIRAGSATKRLVEDRQRYQALIQKLRTRAWESSFAACHLASDEVLDLLDADTYCSLMRKPLPADRESVLDMLKADNLIQQDVGKRWNIFNVGALLFAKELRQFGESLARKGLRFVRYAGTSKTSVVTYSLDIQKGYAAGFQEFLCFADTLLPRNERFEGGIRRDNPLFPMKAVRELVANALIHQDMAITGAGPIVELFSNRIEITNPGASLIDTKRIIDHAPSSRNKILTSLMRRMGMCEARGAGLDKAFAEIELFQLPALRLNSFDDAMQVILYGPKSFADMSTDERAWACYWHTVLRYVAGDRMHNSTLRRRLGIGRQNAAQASVVIRRALEDGLIKYADAKHPRAGYNPAWA